MMFVTTHAFYIEQVQNVTVVCFTHSTLVERNFEMVSGELLELAEYVTSSRPIQVVLDLSHVRTIDDWGVAMLRAFHETIHSSGGATVFSHLQPVIFNIFQETGLKTSFHICETRCEAIGSFKRMND